MNDRIRPTKHYFLVLRNRDSFLVNHETYCRQHTLYQDEQDAKERPRKLRFFHPLRLSIQHYEPTDTVVPTKDTKHDGEMQVLTVKGRGSGEEPFNRALQWILAEIM
jgi:hypothetical protein